VAYPTTSIIQWAKISQVLAFKAVGRDQLDGGYLDPELHQKLKIERDILQWEYDQDPASDNLYQMNAYVLALCAPYIFEAMSISGASGSAVTPAVPGSSYIYHVLDETVGTGSGPTNGLATYTHSDMVGGTQLDFLFVDNMPLSSGVDFSFDSSTGTITLLLTTWITGSIIRIPFNKRV
jgi:hypothetical protein